MTYADVLESRALGLRVQRDESSNDEVGRAHVEAVKGGNATDRRGNPGIGDLACLLRAYPDEFLYLPFVPVPVQRALAVPLSKLGSPRQ